MVIVIALLLDEVIQEVAIFCTDVLSQGQGTRRALFEATYLLLAPRKRSRSLQIRKPQLQRGIYATVSSAKTALREGRKQKGVEA